MSVPEGAAYALVASRVAVSNILSSLVQESLGTLASWTVRVDDAGSWVLSVVVRSSRHGDAEVRRTRVVLHESGADKDPELAGMVYASALVEQLFAHRDLPEPGRDGVVDLP
jgi:hypothetical protein